MKKKFSLPVKFNYFNKFNFQKKFFAGRSKKGSILVFSKGRRNKLSYSMYDNSRT